MRAVSTLFAAILVSSTAFAVPIVHMDYTNWSGSTSVLTLPGYGSVRVTENFVDQSNFIVFPQTQVQNMSAGGFSWGTDTVRLNALAPQPNPDYTVTYDFLNGAPNPSRLLLIVAGIAVGSNITADQPGSLMGEVTVVGSSNTVLTGQTFTNQGNADQVNTGWALYQMTNNFTQLNLHVHQIPGDGLGYTLAYTVVPEPATAGIAISGIIGALGMRRRAAR